MEVDMIGAVSTPSNKQKTSKMKTLTTLEIVKTLIGSIEPSGSSDKDVYRFKNLKEMCELIEELICMIDHVRNTNNSAHEHSIKIMVAHVNNFLNGTIKEFVAS